MQVLAVVVALCFALAVAQPPIPQTPDQFQANIKITTEGIFPTVTQGVYYYDYPNQRERIEVSQFGDTSVTVNLYNEMVSYTWDTMAGKCQCSALTDPMSPANVPYGATYEGTGVVGTTPVTIWGLEDPIMKQVGMSILFYVSNQDYVVRINTTTASPFGSNTILMDLSGYVVGAPAASEFTPASYCSCPPPPPPPGAGSCPGNPGQACQCASTTQLSFCTEVNYPISNTIDVQFTDQFVETAYNAAIQVIPNPSANCQANFKAFLCAFYFGECVGTETPITWLPCADICPFCDCGTLAGNCTSAPSNLPCTQYGTSFCS